MRKSKTILTVQLIFTYYPGIMFINDLDDKVAPIMRLTVVWMRPELDFDLFAFLGMLHWCSDYIEVQIFLDSGWCAIRAGVGNLS